MPQRILVFRIGQIGDLLVSLPAFWAVRHRFPDARLDMLTGAGGHIARELFAGMPLFDRMDAYPVQAAIRAMSVPGLMAKLRQRRYDAAVYLAPTGRSSQQISRDRRFFRMVGIRRVIGLDAVASLPQPAIGQPLPMVAREADMLLARLAADGVPTPDAGRGEMNLCLGDVEREAVDRWDQQTGTARGSRPMIAVAPGSAMPAKVWPMDRFVEVASRLADRYGVWPIVVGGSAEAELGERFIESCGCGQNAAGQLGLRASAEAMRRCRLYVGNDTGAMHLAAAAGVPCVAIFSARTHPGHWYPYGAGHRVLRGAVSCEGCGARVCDQHDHRCLTEITADAVYQACAELLA